MRLREYQLEAVKAAIESLDRGRDPVIQLPTGAGKSLVAAEICRQIVGSNSSSRVLVVTHVKELVQQDSDTVSQHLGGIEVGVVAAGLKRFEVDRQVVVGSVQTVTSPKRLASLPPFGVVIVDEAHLVGPREGSRYQQLRERLGARWVGLSATPWRLDGGDLIRMADSPFSDLAYEVGVQQLIDLGHLCPLEPVAGRSGISTEGVALRGGEFQQSALAGSAMELVDHHADQILEAGADRRSWLTFCSSVEHAEALSAALSSRGVPTPVVSQKTPAGDRDALVGGHRQGSVRSLASVGVLTTGFDSPGTDLVVLARATASSALFCQMVGRGLRTSPGKLDLRVLDLGGNFVRHGCVTSPLISCHGTATSEIRARVCEECGAILALRARVCQCGHELPQVERRGSLTARDQHRTMMAVGGISVAAVVTKAENPAVRVTYTGRSGVVLGSEWLFPEGPQKWQRAHWRQVWRDRGGTGRTPQTCQEAAHRWGELRAPLTILATPGKWPGALGTVRWSPLRTDRFSVAV